jgi:glycolate oxidase FAD binding subunit
MNLPEEAQQRFGNSCDVRTASDQDAVDGVAPQVVLSPRTEQAAHEIVRWCGSEGHAFVAHGGGSKLHVGAKPSRLDIILSTELLNQIFEHDEGNGTVEAGAGITLDELNRAVGERGQFVPLDWKANSGATLGGVVATNHFGATKLRYGTPRDLVVGLRAALSDGRYVKAGSKVVKNVSGYDLNKLFIGSFGTLGFITRVTLRLRPHDAVQRAWQSTFASWDEARTCAREILEGAFEPALLRVVARESTLALHARFDGGEAAVASQLARLPQSQTPADADACPILNEQSLVIKATLPLARAMDWAQQAQGFSPSKVLWECGLGVVRAEFATAPENAEQIVKELRNLAEKAEGFAVVTRAPHHLKTPEFVWGTPRSDSALQRQLKSTLDAANVCAPGRY